MALRVKKPAFANYPKQLKTLGDHLKKRRLDLKMLQKEVATKLTVADFTYRNWEKNWRYPSIIYMPKIIEFLDYIPWDISCKNLGEKIKAYRKISGFSQRELAHKIGVDPSTIGYLEKDKHKPGKRLKRKVNALLSSINQISPTL